MGHYIPIEVMKQMIESGQVKAVNLDGTPFDSNKLVRQEKAEDVQKMIALGGYRKLAVKVDDREYTVAQIEHFGDAVVDICARVLCHELFGRRSIKYFRFAARMITNQNFRSSPDVQSAAQFEILIGQAFIEQGVDAAIKLGIELLKTTKVYQAAEVCSKSFEEYEEEPSSEHVDKAPLNNPLPLP